MVAPPSNSSPPLTTTPTSNHPANPQYNNSQPTSPHTESPQHVIPYNTTTSTPHYHQSTISSRVKQTSIPIHFRPTDQSQHTMITRVRTNSLKPKIF